MKLIYLFLITIYINPITTFCQSTSFFHLEQKDHKWQLIDPEGSPFHMRGCNHYGNGDHMPWNLKEKYGTVEKWRQSVKALHQELGFTYLPPSIGPSMISATEVTRTPEWPAGDFAELNYPFTAFLEVGKQYMAGEGMPDVFSETFAQAVDQRCQEFVAPLKTSKNLIGYHFTHNPPWNINATSAEDWIRACTQPGSAGLKAWARHMKKVYGTIDRWRATYGTPIEKWSDIEKLERPLRAYVSGVNFRKDKESFLQEICEKWYQIHHDAIRKYDPYHLILGDRNTLHLQVPPEPWAYHIMSKYIDVLSVNVMGPPEIVYDVLEPATRSWNGPILLADTGAGIYDVEPGKSTWEAKDLAEYEKVYSGLIRMSMEHPQIIGFGWCGYYESPYPRARSGIVAIENDEPLEERVEIIKRWNQKMDEYMLRPDR